MAEGIVLWFNLEKGEGAVRPDGWASSPMPSQHRRWWRRRRQSYSASYEPAEVVEPAGIPFRRSEIQMKGYQDVEEGQRVSFAIQRLPSGSLEATHVVPLE
ncbi:cold-shock protein [Micromonospora sp. CPCC 206061]|uniref:cold-shock protein n=1 Tax=Micromonospora sp. CPCC 206061 TaxID=3122410 RepID=UPI002FF2F5CF